MGIRLSTEALAQITAKDVEKYVECKLYDASGTTHICDLPIQNASYSKSRQFGVNSLNLQIPNTDKLYTTGTYEIKRDYIIVLIEGYVTATATDKIPTFRGRVKDINHTQSSSTDMLSITVYGELMLLQRSDINKIYVADTQLVEDEVLEPVIDNIAGYVDEVNGDYIRIYDNGNNILSSIIDSNSIFIDDNRCTIINDGTKLYIKPLSEDIVYNYGGGLGMSWTTSTEYIIYYTGTCEFTVGETIQSSDNEFTAIYKSNSTLSSILSPNKYIKVTNPLGKIVNDVVLTGLTSGKTVTAKIFYYIPIVSFYDGRKKASDIATVGNKVNDGVVDKFRANNTNWDSFKLHKINITRTSGDVSKDDDYDGYDIKETLGIVKLNNTVTIGEYIVKATYYYYPVGLYIEDIITDLLITSDSLNIDLIKNGKFINQLTDWTVTSNYLSSPDIVIKYEDGINITNKLALTGGNYISLKQAITIRDDYSYLLKFNISQTADTTGNYYIYLNGTQISTGTDILKLKYVTETILNTLSNGTYDLEIRLYNMVASSKTRINDIKLTYNPARINSFNKDNLYCKLSIENGNTDAISLAANSELMPIPRYKNLIADLIYTSTVIELNNVTGLEATGTIKIDDEFISYSSISGNNLVISARGVNSTTIVEHVTGKRVYQMLPTGRIWYLPYSNIIPATLDATASDYGYTGSIDLTTSNFTVTGSTFKEIFYRDGIVITDGVATAVQLKASVDYLFNQIQTSAIETPYILIDYKQLSNRFDAINEIRSMLAPNYIIDEVVRKNGSTYQTYIRGRYLAQKTNADYNLDFITDITYSEPINTYNRVKMFGKTSNPINLMYNDNTNVYDVNDYSANNIPLYLKGVGYKYIQSTETDYIYSNEVDTTISSVSPTSYLDSIPLYNNNYFSTNYNFVSCVYQLGTKGGGFMPVKISYNGVPSISGANIIKVSSSNFYMYLYNIYYINYTTVGALSIGDIVNDGSNYGTIKYIQTIGTNAGDDAIIFIEMFRTSIIFPDSTVITNGVVSGTLRNMVLDSVSNQVNYNATKSYNLTGRIYGYSITTGDFNTSVDYTPVISKTKLYINDLEVKSPATDELWGEQLLELSANTVVKTDRPYRGGLSFQWYNDEYIERLFDSTSLYINTYDDYKNDVLIAKTTYGVIPVGTVRLEKIDKTGTITVLLTLNYIGDVNDAYIGAGDHAGTLSNLLKLGKLYYKKRDGHYESTFASQINDATHIRFYSKYAYDVRYTIKNKHLYLNKSDIDSLALKADKITVKLDGKYIVNIPNEYIDNNIPIITRLRTNTVKSKDSQVSIVSRLPLDGIDLFIVDLGEVKDIGYMDIQGGFLFKPKEYNDEAAYDCKFKLDIMYSDKDEVLSNLDLVNDFSLISEKTEDIEMTQGKVISLSDSDLGEYFKARYIKFNVSTGSKADISTSQGDDKVEFYGAAISSIAIYDNGILKSEKYVPADVINLYKDSTIYEELNTQDKLDRYAQYNLDEFQKDNTTVSINSPIGTHYEIGMTVNLNDTENSINQNYFIEEINSDNGAVSMSLARYE